MLFFVGLWACGLLVPPRSLSRSLVAPALCPLSLASLDYVSTLAGPERMRAAVPLEDLTIGAKGGQNRLKGGKN